MVLLHEDGQGHSPQVDVCTHPDESLGARDDVLWKLQTMFRAGSWSAHALLEQGGTLTEDVQLRGRSVQSNVSPGMREFFWNSGVDRMSPPVLL